MKLPTALLITLLTFQAEAWSANPEKLDLALGSLTDQRGACITVKGICYHSVTRFLLVELRHKGHWTESPLLKELDADTLATLSAYSDFAIRNLAIADKKFFVEIDFNYGPEQQVNYVLGDIEDSGNGKPSFTVSFYADRSQDQQTERLAVKNLENTLNPRRDFQSVDAQVRAEDILRSMVVEPILYHTWRASLGEHLIAGGTKRALTVNAEIDH